MPLHCPTDHRPVLEIFTKTVQNFTKIGEIWGKNPIIGVPLVFWVFASRNPKIKPIMWHGWVSRVVGVFGPRGGVPERHFEKTVTSEDSIGDG